MSEQCKVNEQVYHTATDRHAEPCHQDWSPSLVRELDPLTILHDRPVHQTMCMCCWIYKRNKLREQQAMHSQGQSKAEKKSEAYSAKTYPWP